MEKGGAVLSEKRSQRGRRSSREDEMVEKGGAVLSEQGRSNEDSRKEEMKKTY